MNYELYGINLVYINDPETYSKVKVLHDCDNGMGLVPEIFETIKQECNEDTTRDRIRRIAEEMASI